MTEDFGAVNDPGNVGIGSRMLRAVLSTCDDNGMPAYLEATTERNEQLYERHGFEITEVLTLPDGPKIWCMWRTADRPHDRPIAPTCSASFGRAISARIAVDRSRSQVAW